jgi:hypothetical protein
LDSFDGPLDPAMPLPLALSLNLGLVELYRFLAYLSFLISTVWMALMGLWIQLLAVPLPSTFCFAYVLAMRQELIGGAT